MNVPGVVAFSLMTSGSTLLDRVLTRIPKNKLLGQFRLFGSLSGFGDWNNSIFHEPHQRITMNCCVGSSASPSGSSISRRQICRWVKGVR